MAMLCNCFKMQVGDQLRVVGIQMVVDGKAINSFYYVIGVGDNSLRPITEPCRTLHVSATGPNLSSETMKVCERPL